MREALELPELKGVQVVGGRNGLDRVIESVNVMETPDISRFVQPGEFLLTTTFPIQNDADAMRLLVPTLAKQGLAGLAIKPRFMKDIPQEMVEQADDLEFPLLCVPVDRPFAGILNAILTDILHHQTAVLRRTEEIHRRLTDLVLRGEGLDAVARTIGALLGLPVLITDHRFHILTRQGLGEQPVDDFTSFVHKMEVEGLYSNSGDPIRRSMWNESHLSTVFIHPVRAGRDVDGYICVWEREGHLGEWDAICIEQGALVTALEMQKQQAVNETERRFYNAFLSDLLAGKVTSRKEALDRATIYGWDLTQPRVLLLFHVVGTGEAEVSLETKLRCQNRIEKAVYYALEEPSPNSLLTHVGDLSILLMVPRRSDPAQAKDEAMKVAYRVLEEVKADNQSVPYGIRIGVSRLQEDVMGWSTAHQQAQEALQSHVHGSAVSSVTHYDDLGVYRLIGRITDLNELERYCEEKIGALLEYDAKQGSDLLTTLKVVIDADGNLHRASELLIIHYNTLRYRIRRIEEIQGLKTDSWSDMSAVDLAIKAYSMLQSRKAQQRSGNERGPSSP